ncbi:uncharacterized protein LOC143009898 isoform X2 [Genypterus blacodes]|uniref:uncharacterized protein LOC143009898 isoform X2 n=1 Tax=Genypterus blacodes TaxID=154954 RepID=UPI003F775EEB
MKRRRPLNMSIDGYQDKSISWTKLAGHIAKYRESKCKHGAQITPFDDGQAALVRSGMASRHPCLILRDVLKTDIGKAYMDRRSFGNYEQVTQSGVWREDCVSCRDKVSALLLARNENSKAVTPDRTQRAPFLSSERVQRRSQNADEAEDSEESRDIGEVIMGMEKREEVVDCGLTVSWKQAPASRKNKRSDPTCEMQHSLKRKRSDIGTNTPTGGGLHLDHRGSSKRQTPVPLHITHRSEEESESLDDEFGQGEESPIRVTNHNMEDRLSNCRLSVSRKHTSEAGGDKPSPASRKDKCTDPSSQRRKLDEPLSHCIGTDTPKSRHGNVLHLSPDKRNYRRQTPVRLHLDEYKEDGESESPVGEDERTQAQISVASLELSSSQESTTKKSPSETNCRLSVSKKLPGDARRDELSPASRTDKCTDPSLQRKRNEAGSHCGETGTPKGRRESVLHLSPERGSYRQRTPVRLHLDEPKEDGESGSQVTAGEGERTEAQILVIVHNFDTRDDTEDRSSSPSEDNMTKTGSSVTIVVSSDEEDGEIHQQHLRPVFHPLVSQEEAVTHTEHTPEATDEQQDTSDTQDMELPYPGQAYPCMDVAFSELYCGRYRGKANGDIKITGQQIIIPLKDARKQVEVTLTVERNQLLRYCVWEEQRVQTWWSDLGNDGPPPAAVLQFSMSKPQVAAVESDLHRLSVSKGETTASGGSGETSSLASPVLLLTLRDPLEGLEGALLRSLLDIDCLSNLLEEEDIVGAGLSGVNGVEDIQTPSPSPSLESSDPETDQDCTEPDREENTSPQTQDESEEESEPEPEKVPEGDAGSRLTPEDEQKEQEVEPPAETNREEPKPIYTLHHARTSDSYSISLAKPDSRWTKYKHHGQPCRLIQFPPPPLKGGISVTMDDLQCLDSGQYLNDVIIDFYLKYLLHNASAAVAERCYIFSSFFYNQLARGNNASKASANDICQRQWRHQRVKNWTRHVDIFKKDFLFVPVNQEAHWFLVLICFPGLDETNHEAWTGPVSQMGKRPRRLPVVQCPEDSHSSKSDDAEASPSQKTSDNSDTPTGNSKEDATKDTVSGPPNCTEQTCQSKTVCKRPCILIMDSLKRCLHQRVVKLLQEYLQSEWDVRRGSSRVFGPENMKCSCCLVPLQDNSTDCGLYLLQYVESFLKDPVVNFELPLHLEHWFSRQQMWRKRDEIRNVVLRLYRQQTL